MKLSGAHTLVADIGGTNTRVALARGPDVVLESVRKFRNSEHAGLEQVLRRYLVEAGDPECRAACVAIAGPVRAGRGTLTNLSWTIDHETLRRATGAEQVDVLNDLQAQGHALGLLGAGSLREILSGPSGPEIGSQLVIGVGTGFNAAPVHHLPGRRFVAPAEAGHGSLPIRSDRDVCLARYVEVAHGFAAVEDVLSGRGLERVYAWLAEERGEPHARVAAEIITGCADGDALASESVAVFVSTLGRVAGDLALHHLPFGGIYLAGGVARAVAPFMVGGGFAEAFRDKGRFADFMKGFSVFVIEDDFAALSGSAAHMARHFARDGELPEPD